MELYKFVARCVLLILLLIVSACGNVKNNADMTPRPTSHTQLSTKQYANEIANVMLIMADDIAIGIAMGQANKPIDEVCEISKLTYLEVQTTLNALGAPNAFSQAHATLNLGVDNRIEALNACIEGDAVATNIYFDRANTLIEESLDLFDEATDKLEGK